MSSISNTTSPLFVSGSSSAGAILQSLYEVNPNLKEHDARDILSLATIYVSSSINSDRRFNDAADLNGGGRQYSITGQAMSFDAHAAARMAEAARYYSPAASDIVEVVLLQDDSIYCTTGSSMLLSLHSLDKPVMAQTITVSFSIDANLVQFVKMSFGTGDQRLFSAFDLGTWTFDNAGHAMFSVTTDVARGIDLQNRFIDLKFGGISKRSDIPGGWSATEWNSFGDQSQVKSGWLRDLKITASVRLIGNADVYHYTDQFAELVRAGVGRAVLTDADGGSDWIDASAVRSDTTVDLTRSSAIIGGVAMNVSGIENVAGGDGTDTLTGNVEPNHLVGMRGNDRLYGAAGNDRLEGGEGADLLDGGLGKDTMIGGLDNDTYIVDDSGDLVVEHEGEGYDALVAKGDYTLAQGLSIELLIADDLYGKVSVRLRGNTFSQTICTGNGNDELDGRGGGDALSGGAGDDRYIVYSTADSIVEYEREGFDVVAVQGSDYTLAAGTEVERIEIASSGKSKVVGNELSQTIVGNGFDNTIDGGGGNDILYGSAKGATLWSNLAKIFSPSDSDTFLFSTALGSNNVDRIQNFETGIAAFSTKILWWTINFPGTVIDRIGLSKSIFDTIGVGTLSEKVFCDMSKDMVGADDRILYDRNTGSIYYDADGSGTQAAIKFAEVDAGLAMKASNFFVYA